MLGGDSVDMDRPPDPVRVVISRLSSLSWTSLVTLKGQLQSFKSGTSKLRCFSVPFSKRFPSWPVPNLASNTPAVGASPGPRFHFPDRDPVNERPAKCFRITGKS